MPNIYPPAAFSFLLEYSANKNTADAAFQEVSGISSELGSEEVREGGENRFLFQLPLPAKHSNLVLKRGLITYGSDLATWCKNTIETDFGSAFVVQDITVSLINISGVKLISWVFESAWPIKWNVSTFNSQENTLAIETIEFAYRTFTKKYITPPPVPPK